MRKTNNKIFSLWLKRLKFNFRAICVFVYMGSDFYVVVVLILLRERINFSFSWKHRTRMKNTHDRAAKQKEREENGKLCLFE
jgi:hypothetical protein